VGPPPPPNPQGSLPGGAGSVGANGEARERERVNHPAHYNEHPSGVECVTIAEAFSFNVGNAVKYLWRAGLKGDRIEDFEKARWYVDREIFRLRGGQ
jgi:hypothetical protein